MVSELGGHREDRSQDPLNQRVPGSSPGAPTKQKPNKIRYSMNFLGAGFEVHETRKEAIWVHIWVQVGSLGEQDR